MKVFRKEKLLKDKDNQLSEEELKLYKEGTEAGYRWATECDGKKVINGMVLVNNHRYLIDDDWCEEIE